MTKERVYTVGNSANSARHARASLNLARTLKLTPWEHVVIADQIGLVLTGGGARAAYQIGVLKAISDMMPDLQDPFPIICGTSAGAINATGLASGDRLLRHNVAHLEKLWGSLRIHDIYRSDTIGMARWLSQFVQSVVRGQSGDLPVSLLDNRPLREFLRREVKFDRITKAIDGGRIKAVALTACGYSSGQNIAFFQGHPSLEAWNQGQRVGLRCTLQLEHLMASSAIPTIFPPVKIHREFFGDGVTRQMAHVSPALHLGAERVLVIGVSANRVCAPIRRKATNTPSIAQVMEHVLNGMFLDTLEFDIDRLLLINQLLELIPPKKLKQSGLNLRPIRLLEISPSQPMEDLAARHLKVLPGILRRLIGRSLDLGEGGSSLASYLMFDKEFCRELISLGYADAQAHSRQLAKFFSPDPTDEDHPRHAISS